MVSKAKRTHFLSLNGVLRYSDTTFFDTLSKQKSCIFSANLISINNLTINALFQTSDVRIELIVLEQFYNLWSI